MRKVKKKIVKRKPKKKNPRWEHWSGLNQDDQINLLESLMGNDIVLNIFDKLAESTQSGSRNIYDLAIWDKYYGTIQYGNLLWEGKFFGNLKCLFQFNPLNQWKYQTNELIKEKVKPIPRTSNKPEFINFDEYSALMEIESQFEHDKPTYEFKFYVDTIFEVENNEIYLQPKIKFKPELIK